MIWSSFPKDSYMKNVTNKNQKLISFLDIFPFSRDFSLFFSFTDRRFYEHLKELV